MTRYTGIPYAQGVLVLDLWTGRVIRVPSDGTPPVVLLDAQIHVASGGGGRPRVDLPVGMVDPTAHLATIPGVGAPTAPATPEDALDREILGSYPYPIARSWRSWLDEEDPRQRCKLLVDTFTSVLKMWAFQVASEYLLADGVRDALVNRTLERDFARPLISAWNLMLRRGLPVLREAGVSTFAPELYRAYDALEVNCEDRFVVSTRYEDADGNGRVKRSKLGKLQALIHYRNSLAHGYNQSRTKALEDLDRYTPVLRDVLAAGRFMVRYPLMYAPRSARAGEPLLVYRFMGAAPSGEPEHLAGVDLDRRSPLFLYDETRQRTLPLLTFFDLDVATPDLEAAPGLGRDVLLFDGNTRSTLIYASVGGHHAQKQARTEDHKALLADKALDLGTLTRDNLTAEALTVAARHKTDAAIEHLVDTGKYIRETTTDRASVSQMFDRFDRGDHRGMVFGGDGGMGKTTLLARQAELWREAGDAVLFYRGSSLADTELAARILRDLGVHGMFFEDFLATADAVMGGPKEESPCLRLIVDAVDEHSGDVAGLVRSIDAIVRQTESFPWFRTCVSVRESAYDRLSGSARFGLHAGALYLQVERQRGGAIECTPLVDVSGFTDRELADVYERYRDYRRVRGDDPEDSGAYLFRPATEFKDLDLRGSTIALMRTPLMMRLVMAAFHRRELPSEISFDDAMGLFVDHVIVERDGHGRPHPERRQFLSALVRQFDTGQTDAMARDQLFEIDRLRGAIQNAQKDSPYVQLLDLGVLLEEWHDDDCYVRFAFDGLLEYFLAELHDGRIEEPRDLVTQASRALTSKGLRKALVVIVRRAVLQRRVELPLGALELSARADDGATTSLLVSVVREVLVELGKQGHEFFELFIDQFAQRGCAPLIEVANQCFDEFFALGETQASVRVAEVAELLASRLSRKDLHAGALLRGGLVSQRRGDLDEALRRLAEAQRLALEAEVPVVGSRADLVRASILMDRLEFEAANELADGAFSVFEQNHLAAEAAEARRLQATLAGRQEQPERQAGLLREAIVLSEGIGDRVRVAKALNNLAMLEAASGAPEAAQDTYLRALAVFDELGDQTSTAVLCLNLATMYSGAMGDLERSRQTLGRAMTLFEETEHQLGAALALNHSGVLHLLLGELVEADEALRKVLTVYEARDEPLRIAYACWLLSNVAFERRNFEEARRLAQRLRAIAVDLGREHLNVQGAALALRSAACDGDRGAVEAALAELESLVPAGVSSWDLEEGPLLAYLDATTVLAGSGAGEAAKAVLRQAERCAGDRPFHRREELDALAARLGIRPRVNVSTVGES